MAAVHNDLAEQAYRSQAQDVLRGTGQLTAERKEYLDQMRQQLGLQQAAADKIIKEVSRRGGLRQREGVWGTCWVGDSLVSGL